MAAQNKKNKKKSEFKTAPDGRLIITDDNSSSEEEHANAFNSGKLSA